MGTGIRAALLKTALCGLQGCGFLYKIFGVAGYQMPLELSLILFMSGVYTAPLCLMDASRFLAADSVRYAS